VVVGVSAGVPVGGGVQVRVGAAVGGTGVPVGSTGVAVGGTVGVEAATVLVGGMGVAVGTAWALQALPITRMRLIIT
jgi:hypothetical protein